MFKALRGKEPDKSAFHRKKREIERLAPQLIEELLTAYALAQTMVVQDYKVEPFIDEDCFPSLIPKGGLGLLDRKKRLHSRTDPSDRMCSVLSQSH